MKNLKIKFISLVALLIFSNHLYAHADHGKISSDKAVQIAEKLSKKMTFKDLGYKAGKIDKSWKEIKVSEFKVDAIQPEYYIVRAYNDKVNKVLEFKIKLSGQVLQVTAK